jgi:methylmalonyl-CoA mutase N-terminal domain/subunit
MPSLFPGRSRRSREEEEGKPLTDPNGKGKSGWLEGRYAKTIEKSPERDYPFETSDGQKTAPLYSPEDLNGWDYDEQLGYPGEFPYTRGVQPTMYRGRLWTMRQYAGFGDAEESNERYRYLLAQGQTGLSVAFDLPTQIGYDSDHAMAAGEVGKVGVAISSLADMELLMKEIPLEKVTTSMTINATAAVLLAFYVALAKKQGADLSKVGGTTQNDILKEYIARGTYIFPPDGSMRLITDVFAYCKDNLPAWNTISISGYHMREAGCTSVQEVAFTLANAITYCEAALKAGLEFDEFAPRVAFFFASFTNLIEEVAKFRAARRLWARIATERFGAKDPRSTMLRFHTQTGGSTLTAQQVENNIVRTAIQALAAVLGGTQSLHTNSMDEALALPTEKSVQIALRTQQVIAFESGVADVIDPLAGSYYVESLTDRIEEDARKYIDRIEDLGGSLRAIESGYQQREIQEASYRYQKSVDEGYRYVVGVNKFTTEEEERPDILRVREEVVRRQVDRLNRVRAERDEAKAQQMLRLLDDAAKSDANLMPVLIESVENYVTLGEICGVLRGVFGEQREYHVF